MKKLCMGLIVILLVLSGCSKSTEEPELPFNDYLDQLLIDSMDPTDIGINFSFIKPEDFGIEVGLYDLGLVDEADYNESFEALEEAIATLESYKDLSGQELMDRNALLASFKLSLESKDFFEYEVGSSILGYSRAFSGNLPAYLETYDFHNERDVLAYLNFLETLPASYQSYLELELKRQESGTGFGQEELDEIIKISQDSYDAMTSEDYFLISDFKTKVEKLSLDKESFYIDEQARLMKEGVAKAYQNIIDLLSPIEAEESKGLAHKPNGKAYYEYLLKSSTGSARSIKEIRKFVEKKKIESLTELAYITQEEGMDAYFERYSKDEFGDFKDGYDLLAFLEDRIKEDFPEIGSVNYELKQVDPSMSEASSPAFYFTPYIDYNTDYLQTIYINGDFDNSLYQTFAHEGYPGHMYQFNYFLSLDMHPIRYLFTENSNAEGWGNYIESIAHSYVEADQNFVDFRKAYDNLIQILHIEMDLGVNYDGWSFLEFSAYLDENFGGISESQAKEIYRDFAHNPAVYPTYYLSNLYINDMKDQVKKEKGSDYSEKEFHKVFLDNGSVGFDLIQESIDRYLED